MMPIFVYKCSEAAYWVLRFRICNLFHYDMLKGSVNKKKLATYGSVNELGEHWAVLLK